MKTGRKSYDQSARQRLLDLWRGAPEFGEPIGCVATTYTFDAAFFEEQCLARFIRMDTDPMEDARGYLIEREERLSQTFACALVDKDHATGHRSLRWHLLPVRAPEGGILHAKVAILAWERCIRVLVGSANLTSPGYRRNYENMASLDFRPDGDLPLSLLRDCIDFVGDVREHAPGHNVPEGPQAALARFLQGRKAQISKWNSPDWRRGEPRCSLVVVGPDKANLFSTLRGLWSGPADLAWVLSPFFNDGAGAQATVAALGDELLLKRGDREILFCVPGHRHGDRTVDLYLPEALRHPAHPSLRHRFAFVPEVDPQDANGDSRPLHAKSLWLQREGRALFLVGSSNFTLAGTGVRHANIEANLAYDLPDMAAPFARTCEVAYPAWEEVNPDDEHVRFLGDGRDSTREAEGYLPLPEVFGAAIFEPAPEGGLLRLELTGTPPAGFKVQSSGGATIIDDAACRVPPHWIEHAWREPRPPSALEVTWPHPDGIARALWIVNVSDTAGLMPPEELRNLALEDLLEVLTSARPLHETVPQVLRRREAKRSTAPGVEVDPHKRVDTRNFLLHRMKRIAAALEGLRERLQRPAFSMEALRWRLHGPLGPLALARRLATEEKDGAAFMIAEVAITLRDARIAAYGDLRKAEVPAEIEAVMTELRALGQAHPAPPNLAAYVAEVFDEIAL